MSAIKLATIPIDEAVETPPTDEQLLVRYRTADDRLAFEELVHRYEQELYSFLWRYLGDGALAEDVFQAAFLQVHLKCRQFEEHRKFRPWLYAIATNQAIDTQRRDKRHRMLSIDRWPGTGSATEDEGGLSGLLQTMESSPPTRFAAGELRDQVREAVSRLPDTLRGVVALVYYQGLKYREAAEVLDIPVGTVKSRLHAAIHRLHENMDRTEMRE